MGTRCAVPLAQRSHQATRRLRSTSGRECWSAVGALNLDLFSAGLTSGTTIVSSRSWVRPDHELLTPMAWNLPSASRVSRPRGRPHVQRGVVTKPAADVGPRQSFASD